MSTNVTWHTATYREVYWPFNFWEVSICGKKNSYIELVSNGLEIIVLKKTEDSNVH